MRLDATPPLADDELEALRIALERTELLAPYTVAEREWTRAARHEGVEPGRLDAPAYALSPRRTLGATRA